jgi:hypothetical protein
MLVRARLASQAAPAPERSNGGDLRIGLSLERAFAVTAATLVS